MSALQNDQQAAPLDQAMRTRFRTVLDRNAVVEAGAGTGKTTLVVERILALVLGRDIGERGAAYPSGGLPVLAAPIPIERIVAITFTDLAAAELGARVRDRLTETLGNARECGDSVVTDLLVVALADLPRASISTIHSFCTKLLREYALDAGLDPGFETLDAVGKSALVEEVFETWFEEIGNRPEVRRVLSFGMSLEKVEEHARGLMELEQPRQAPPSDENEARLPLRGKGGVIERFLLDMQIEANYFRGLIESGVDLPDDGLRMFYRSISAVVAEHAALVGSDASSKDWDAFELEIMQPVWAKGSPPGPRLQGAKWKKAMGEGETSDYKDRHDEQKGSVLEIRRAIGADLVSGIEPSLLEFRKHYQDEKERLAKLDFEDLLASAEQLVRNHPVVRAALIRRYSTIFVDEFQDTSPVQASFVFFLAGGQASVNERDWRRVQPAPGRLVLVGDPKQSIYRFRSADVEIYKACCDLVCEADPEAMLQISTNFRSDGPLVDWINEVFHSESARMEAPQNGEGYQADYIDLIPWHKERGSASPVLVLTPEDKDRISGAGAMLEVEALAVARYLKGKLSGGAAAFAVGGEKIGYGDIAIVARTRKSLAAYGIALAAEGIPFVLEGGGNLFEQDEVCTALTLLSAVVEPGRETAVVGALRSTWFALSDDELAEHKLAGGTWMPLDDALGGTVNGHPRVLAALGQLGSLAAQARELEPSALVTVVLRNIDQIAIERLRTAGVQAPMNLRVLEAFLQGRLAEGGVSLGAAVRMAENLQKRKSGESGARLASDGAIRMMTVHGSKGLEFGMVILAQPGRATSKAYGDPWWDQDGLIWRLGKDYEHPEFGAKVAWDKERNDAEGLRLFYVALTRAEHYLLLPLFGSHKETKKDGLKSNLTVALATSMGKYLTSSFEGFEDGAPKPALLPQSVPTSVPAATAPSALERSTLGAHLAPRDGVESRATEFADRMQCGPVTFGPSTVADEAAGEQTLFPDASGGNFNDVTKEQARHIGTLTHKGIELGLDREAALRLCADAGLDEQNTAFVSDCIERERQLESAQRARDSWRVFNEPSVQWATSSKSGKPLHMRGFIDRLIQFEDGSVEVIDFKTDRVTGSAIQERALHHRTQLALYGLALESAGMTVRALTLAFLASGEEVSFPLDAEARAQAYEALENL